MYLYDTQKMMSTRDKSPKYRKEIRVERCIWKSLPVDVIESHVGSWMTSTPESA